MRRTLCGMGLALWMLCAPACAARPTSGTDALLEVDSLGTKYAFELPEVPASLTRPEDRLHYVVQHYWDCFDFRDTALIRVPEAVEQALVNYLDLLPRVDAVEADSSLTRTLCAAQPETAMYRYFAEELRRYLYEPLSPLRNETLYVCAARYIAAHPEADIAAQARAAHDLRLIALNRPGTSATDFSFEGRDGTQGSLSALRLATPLLVLFYDPDCESCRQTIARMKVSQSLAEAVGKGRLAVLAVYAEGDEEVWKECCGMLPREWMDVRDPQRAVLERELYDLSAPPTLYLLTADRKVVLKEAQWDEVEDFLRNIEK